VCKTGLDIKTREKGGKSLPGVGDVKDVAELEGKAPAGHSLVSGGIVVEQGPDIKA
jgi:hypothetical protein